MNSQIYLIVKNDAMMAVLIGQLIGQMIGQLTDNLIMWSADVLFGRGEDGRSSSLQFVCAVQNDNHYRGGPVGRLR